MEVAMKAVKGKEITFSLGNKVGQLEEVSKRVSSAGVNIRAVSAWVADDKAYFRLVTSDNAKTKAALAGLGAISEKDVVIVEMPDKTGQLHALASKLKDNSIDLTHIYGTTSEAGRPAIIILSSNNNDKALEVIAG